MLLESLDLVNILQPYEETFNWFREGKESNLSLQDKFRRLQGFNNVGIKLVNSDTINHLKRFHNLETLYIWNIGLEEFPLEVLELDLEGLYIGENNINYVPIDSRLLKLKELVLTGNPVGNLEELKSYLLQTKIIF